jgi:hypothetical protein
LIFPEHYGHVFTCQDTKPLGRSRGGGLSTKVHALCASEIAALDIRVAAGQAGERLFNKIKPFRRVATRYEKLKDNFFAFVTLALIIVMVR